MRYESALEIVRFLKRVYGTPVPILRIVQNINLSYQPTHKHVRTLEQLHVVEAVKRGREVLCGLRASEATHAWLALLAVTDRGTLMAAEAPLGELATVVRRTVLHHAPAGLEAAALREPQLDTPPGVVLMVNGESRDAALRRFSARCRSVVPDGEVCALTWEELDERLADPLERQNWVAHMHPLHGEQRFWAAVLPDETRMD